MKIQTQHPEKALKPLLYGAGLGFLTASFFVILFAGNSDTITSSLFLPLLTVPVGGGIGGLFFHLMRPYRHQKGAIGLVALIISLLVFLVGIWLSLVAALSVIGLWD